MGALWVCVGKKKITGGLVVIFPWPFVLRSCRVKYCPQDRREKKKLSQCFMKKFQPLAPGNHSLSKPLSRGDIFPCFPSMSEFIGWEGVQTLWCVMCTQWFVLGVCKELEVCSQQFRALYFMLSEHVHAESFFVTILGRVVKGAFHVKL